MLEALRFAARRRALIIADYIVTMPLLRWSWTGLAEEKFGGALPEYRPSDREAVRDMMAGRYLLASKLVETGGVSPFGIDVEHADWETNLQGFSWLRHFRDVRDEGERRFARTLVLDWIGREGQFDRQTWALGICAQRVLNWLRHLPLLLEGANADQTRTILRCLGTQIQSLRVRRRFAANPVDRLLAAIALVGAAVCDQNGKLDVEDRVTQLNAILADQIDKGGMHFSRSPRTQLQLLVELSSVRRSLNALKSELTNELGAQVDRMHAALDVLTLGSGEPVYANGTGHLAHDVLIAVQANGTAQRRKSTVLGGYGILRDGDAVVIADGGRIPEPDFAADTHSGGLSFEFSHGTELIIGNCGPAPADLPQSKLLFRQGVAHSAPTINAQSAAPIRDKGLLSGLPVRTGAAPTIMLNAADQLLTLGNDGYAARFGVALERRLTLLAGGTTLVGQDEMKASGTTPVSGVISVRFHLSPGIMLRRNRGEGIVRLVLPNGAVWSFLWEGAELREEESVRQSAYVGFNRTNQLVLETEVEPGREIAWIFTREQG
ncbi:heparinase II/III family protein [Devosia sp.]|uniref:heparinase II/III family protein n=1 Tax=Devosia sp. TaxID=1871048 RepID=UPI0032670866